MEYLKCSICATYMHNLADLYMPVGVRSTFSILYKLYNISASIHLAASGDLNRSHFCLFF